MTEPDHRTESDAGVIFGEDGSSVIDPDGRPLRLRAAPAPPPLEVLDTESPIW